MKRFLTLLLCLAMVFCFAACGGSEEPADNSKETTGDRSLQAVLDRGVLRVGAEGNWAPYSQNASVEYCL